MIELAKPDQDIQKIRESITTPQITYPLVNRPAAIDLVIPIFEGDIENEHPKKFLRSLNTYIKHKKCLDEEKMVVIENCLKEKAAKWFSMIKDAALNEANFTEMFLKYLFSEKIQWSIFIKCTEAGKTPIKENYQEHFHHWMDELKYLDSPKMNENQAINLITKHFPLAVQAYIQNADKNFLSIWEKLGEIENTPQGKEETTDTRLKYNHTFKQNQNQQGGQQIARTL